MLPFKEMHHPASLKCFETASVLAAALASTHTHKAKTKLRAHSLKSLSIGLALFGVGKAENHAMHSITLRPDSYRACGGRSSQDACRHPCEVMQTIAEIKHGLNYIWGKDRNY